jgi:hypothetical protein
VSEVRNNEVIRSYVYVYTHIHIYIYTYTHTLKNEKKEQGKEGQRRGMRVMGSDSMK